MSQKKLILNFFNLPQSQYGKKYDALAQEDKMILDTFLNASQGQEQITQQMLVQGINSFGNTIEILTKRIHVFIKKPGKFKRSKDYILQQVMVNPLFQRQGIFKRFLEKFQKSIPSESRIIIESVIGDNLLKYIEKYPQHFKLIPGTYNSYYYIPNQQLQQKL
jgi:hypothetical protein